MRLAVCAMSAVLLSGCSWLGGGHSGYGYGQAHKAPSYGHQSQSAAQSGQYGSYNGFPQKPNFSSGYGAPTYTTGSYGSHAANAGHKNAAYSSTAPQLKKPRIRGSLSLGFEKSTSGALLDYAKVPGIDPEIGYNPNDYAEGTTTGSVAAGNVTSTTYTGAIERINKPTISFDDVYSTPARIAGGVEFITSPHVTLFANGAYSHAEGNEGAAVQIDATLLRQVSSQDYDDAGVANGPAITNTSFIPNATIAHYAFDFSDMKRIDLEVGGRYYFDPVVKDQAHRTLTPFVGASVGASHYNKTDFAVSQQQLYYQRAFDSNLATQDFYDVNTNAPNVQIYDAQWTPSGTLTAGMEWQVTPKSALALETGMRFEKARDYSNGAKGDSNIAVPLTLRGSFNF